MAACAVLVLLAHLLFAQLTFVLAVAFAGVSKASRWRWWWLAVPAATGLGWTLVIGPRAAAAGFAAGPAQIIAYLGRGGQSPIHLLDPRGAFTGAGGWLPRQLPLARIAGGAVAGVARWLDWMHTDEWEVAAPRPGAFAAVRSALNRRAIRAGRVLTRDGCCLGVAPATGARVVLSWPEAAGGILVTGAAAETVSAASLQVVHAALRRRKPVITIDMSGGDGVGRALAAACAATGTPLLAFGAPDGCYEPFRHADPERRLAMTLALLGSGSADGRSADGLRTCLRAVFELMDAVPAGPDTAVLDDAAHLLNPQSLRARFGLVPADGPRRDRLARFVEAAARAVLEDPRAVHAAARQLADVRRSPAGRWLCPGGDGIDLTRAVRERSAVLFRVGDPAVARLVCADIAATGEHLRGIGVDGDGLGWLHGCDGLPPATLAGLATGGTAAGLPLLLSSTSPATAELAGSVNAVLIHRLADDAAAARLAERTGARMVPATAADAAAAGPAFVSRPAVPARSLLSLAPGRFVLAVNSPCTRVVPSALAVPARLPGEAPPRAARLAPVSRQVRQACASGEEGP